MLTRCRVLLTPHFLMTSPLLKMNTRVLRVAHIHFIPPVLRGGYLAGVGFPSLSPKNVNVSTTVFFPLLPLIIPKNVKFWNWHQTAVLRTWKPENKGPFEPTATRLSWQEGRGWAIVQLLALTREAFKRTANHHSSVECSNGISRGTSTPPKIPSS